MSIKERMAAKTASIAPLSGERRPSSGEPKTGPGKFMAVMPMLAEKEKELETAEAENATLREQLAKVRGGIDLSLKELIEVPGRRRHMPAEKYAELRENLRRNALIHPVVVRRTESGQHEIISGHHRVDVFRELGRETIRVVVLEGDEEQASDGAFFANLMQSDLTDYEKYLGFKDRQNRHPEITQSQLAEQSGLSESLISYILSFDNLPAAVLSACAERPSLLGSRAASLLANLAKQGRTEHVVQAVQKLIAGEVDQAQAVKLAANDIKPKKAAPAPVTLKVKRGRAVFCEVRRAKNVMRLQFQSEDEAERIQTLIQQLLESEAGETKSSGN
jgi:ParB family transcriptional regulator, chromosome partitioning protein